MSAARGVSNEFSSKLYVVVFSALLSLCGFGLYQFVDSVRARVLVLEGRDEGRGERIVKTEESFKWVSIELARLSAETQKVNDKLDRILSQNR